jgi:hypothetical protein
MKLAMKDVGKFYCHSVYLTAISYIDVSWVYFMVILVCFSRFGMLYQEKSGNPVFDLLSKELSGSAAAAAAAALA